MKVLLCLIFLLSVTACTAPNPPTYYNAPKVPINHPDVLADNQ